MQLTPRPGTTCVTLRAAGANGDSLRRAADALTVARHPGVPELLGIRGEGAGAELDVAVPDGVPLRSLALTIEEVAGLAATLGTTLGDLHEIGVAVGTVTVESVTVTREGAAVLTDVTRATRLGSHRSKWAAHPVARRDDRDLARLVTDLLDACAPAGVSDVLDGPPRWARVLRGGRPSGTVARVRELAERASTGALSSRRLAEALATEVPGACLPRRAPTTNPHGPHEPPPLPSDAELDRWIATHQLADRDRTPGDDRPATGRAPRVWASRARPIAALGCVTLFATVATVLLLSGGPGTNRSADCVGPAPGCATIRAGLLSVGGVSYAVGESDDVAAVGRWDCGAPSLALLRPSTGQIWLYRGWPSGTAPVRPSLGAVVPGARRLTVSHGATCDTLLVVRGDGTRLPVAAQVTR
jgi:hypothetical protein